MNFAFLGALFSTGVGLLFLFLYFKGYSPKVQRNPWVLALALLALTAAGYGYWFAYHQAHLLSQVEKHLASRDLWYKSPTGFSIMIPAGFTYYIPRKGSFKLIAAKDLPGGTRCLFSVNLISSSENPRQVALHSAKRFQRRYSHFQYQISGSLTDALLDFSFEHQNAHHAGLMRFIKQDKRFFIVSALAKNLSPESPFPPGLQKALNSFKILP